VQRSWSFSDEWDAFFNAGVTRTWDWDVQERLEMFLAEVQLSREKISGLMVLDAGCGNGLLTEAIASLGATVIGIDYSNSVHRIKKGGKAIFLRGDLNAPPFRPETFDIVFSSGVLHHTANTRAAFDQVAHLVKPEGRLYVWLYRKVEGLRNRLIRTREALIRPICCRLSHPLQSIIVKGDAALQWAITRFVGKRRSFAELVVASYDALTPRYAWKHHAPLHLARWFYEDGFSAPILTHWDNPNGYGIMAIKREQATTPGVRYGLKKL
jgi:2-polyprenyl-3-methyl-5-hydroxy-6-metoxy-1,4-benzoquinol methylase